MYPVFVELPNPFGAAPLVIYWYGTWWVIAFVVGLVWFARRGRRQLGIPADQLLGLAVLVVLGGVVGSKLLSVLTYLDAFLRDPLAVLLGRGRWSVVGGLIGGGLVAWAVMRRVGQIGTLHLADVITPPLLLGQALGRQGCFAVGCCHGTKTDAWWGVTFTHPLAAAPLGLPLVPTQLLECVLDVVLLILLLLYERRSPARRVGQLFAVYALGYGAIRFTVEFWRGDAQRLIAGLSTNQWAVLLGVALVAVLFVRMRTRGALAASAYADPPTRTLFSLADR